MLKNLIYYDVSVLVEEQRPFYLFKERGKVVKFHTNFLYHFNYTMESTSSGKTKEKLCYSGQRCQKIPEALIKLYGTKVHRLDLSYNELISLKGLEGFPLLQELILDNNELTDSLVLPYMPYLNLLSLNKNRIYDLESLITKIQENLPSLSYLSLLGNKACPNQLSDIENDDEDYQRYRYYILHHLPKLKFLDSSKVKEVERQEAKKRGYYMKILRPKSSSNDSLDDDPYGNQYTPLPRTLRNIDDHRGAYVKCRKQYNGKHSEGNRFISNNDL